MLDNETLKINEINNHLRELVNHTGWKIAREKITEKILELQNVSEYVDIIQTGNATKLLKEMKANKRAAEILFNFLSEIEGNAQMIVEKPTKNPLLYEID